MINSEKSLPERSLSRPDESAPKKQVESREKVPIKVNDLRDPSAKVFDLARFLNMIERLRTENLFNIDREFKSEDYGQYMRFATSESNSWSEAVKKAQAIEITLTTRINRGVKQMIKGCEVEVRVLISATEGRAFHFYFDGEGKYSSAGWDNVHFQKRLGQGGAPDDFELIEDKTKRRQIK